MLPVLEYALTIVAIIFAVTRAVKLARIGGGAAASMALGALTMITIILVVGILMQTGVIKSGQGSEGAVLWLAFAALCVAFVLELTRNRKEGGDAR